MMGLDDLRTTEAAWNDSRAKTIAQTSRAGIAGALAVTVVSAPAIWLSDRIYSGSAHVALTSGLIGLAMVPVLLVMVRERTKQLRASDQLMQQLARELHHATEVAQGDAERRETQVRRQEFETRLASALEMAEGEPEVVEVIERALSRTVPDLPVEVLLADNSHAHVTRMAFSSPSGEPPRCGVDSPDRCPAARRAQVQRFASSEDLDACPKLRGRESGPCSAVCVPVSIMGRTVGVIHATAEPHAVFEEDAVAELGTLANLAGARIGLLRMMAESQLQAATDSLTGLLNRRALESEVRKLRDSGAPFAIAMGDLDHFKELNDVYGHDTGDRALRLFAQTLRSSLRRQDVVCRHGGEEFVVVLPHCQPEQARQALEGVRTRLAAAIATAGAPQFTVSFGVVRATVDDELPDVLARADGALFQAKHDGRDRIVVHDDRAWEEPTRAEGTHTDVVGTSEPAHHEAPVGQGAA